jgi:hypothetical protein
MERERWQLPIQWKAASDGSGEIEGHAAVFGNVDLQGDLILKGAFKKTLSDWSRAKGNIPLVDGHLADSAKTLLGSVSSAKEDATGLWFRAGFASDEASQAVRTKALEGHLTGVSIGWLPMPDGVTFKRGGDGEIVRVLSEVRLFEISLTPIPANPEAQLTSVKSAGTSPAPETTTLDYEQFADAMAKALGLPAVASKVAVDALLGAYHPSEQAAGPADEPEPTADAAAPTGQPDAEPAGDTAATQAEAEHQALRHRIDDATAYALRVIHLEPRDGALVGTPPLARAGALAPLEVAQAMGDLDRLEAELHAQNAQEGN